MEIQKLRPYIHKGYGELLGFKEFVYRLNANKLDTIANWGYFILDGYETGIVVTTDNVELKEYFSISGKLQVLWVK